MKTALKGCQFINDDEVKEKMHSWLHMQTRTFFSQGITVKLLDGPSALKSKETMSKHEYGFF
jgi:hypothetical protein